MNPLNVVKLICSLDEPLRSYLRIKVRESSLNRHACQRSSQIFLGAGATHLYLLDFSPTNLPELKSTIESSYPDVKVAL